MKKSCYCLIRLLAAILCVLIIFALMLPTVPEWGSEEFRFFRWLFSIALVVVLPLLAGIAVLIFLPIPGEKEAFAVPQSKNSMTDNSRMDSPDIQLITTEDELAQFHASHIIIASYDTKVRGVTFDNADGSSRQRIISRCNSGDEIALQYFEYKGEPAYAVLTRHGQIGNLSADQARIINQDYDGCIVEGTINKITGGYDGLDFGCNIHLTFYREAPTVKSREDSFRIPFQGKHQKTPPVSSVSDQFVSEAQWYAARSDSSEE